MTEEDLERARHKLEVIIHNLRHRANFLTHVADRMTHDERKYLNGLLFASEQAETLGVEFPEDLNEHLQALSAKEEWVTR